MKKNKPSAIFIDALVDYAFKKLFGQEDCKDLLIDLLNTFMPGKKIVDIVFLNNERLGKTKSSRHALFDLFCITSTSEYIIIEVQRAIQDYIKSRGLFYLTHAIAEQSEKGKTFNFKYRETWFFCITDFIFDYVNKEQIVHTIKAVELETGKIFDHILNSIYIELPKFKKALTGLETRRDKWLFVLKNLSLLQEIPLILKGDEVFEKLFQRARIANLTIKEMNAYQLAQKDYSDHVNIMSAAVRRGEVKGEKRGEIKGEIKGEKRGRLNVAQKMLQKRVALSVIEELTGLARNEILQLKKAN